MNQNKKIIIIFAILLVASFSISLAYFTSSVESSGGGNSTTATTTTVRGTTIAVEGKLEFDDTDIYPGHRNLAMIKVTGTSTSGTELVAYNVIWEGTNELSTPLNYNIYRVTEEVNATVSCTKTQGRQGTSKIYYETCENTNFEDLGSIVSTGTISGNSVTLLSDEFMNATTSGTVAYYYVVLEYPNINDSQNSDMGATFDGELSIEKSDAKDTPTLAYSVNSSTSGSNGWYNSLTLNVTGSNTSPSTVTSLKYCTTTDNECTPTTLVSGNSTTIELSSNASTQKVCAISISNHDVESEVTCSDTYKVDSGLPSIAYSIQSSTEGNNGWYKTLSIKVEGTTTGSSVSSINYCITSNDTCTPDSLVNATSSNVGLPNNASTQKICAESTSEAGITGNVICSSSYSVDNEAPTVEITSTSSTTNSITVNVSGSDSHSGVVTYYYSINDGLYQSSNSNSYTFNSLSSGTEYTIKAYAEDNTGNTSEIVSRIIKTPIPKTISQIYATATAGSTSIANIADTNEGIKYIADGMYGGTTYYYRGAVNNNWVKFAGIYWRIIRFNGDGSIRMIYSGTTAPTSSTAIVMTGDGTQIGTGSYNSDCSGNECVGYYYKKNQVHGTTIESTIAEILNTWYINNLNEFTLYIDQNGKFCNDRQPSTSSTSINNSGGYGGTLTYFAPYIRINSNLTATTSCTTGNDIFQKNIGLITTDEAAFAGGNANSNYSYFLNTNEVYWTMSAGWGEYGSARSSIIWAGGNVSNGFVTSEYGIRPVINLIKGTTFTGSGTYDDVYKVVGTSD